MDAKIAIEACKAAIKYDLCVQQAAAQGEQLVVSPDLDLLYYDWMHLAYLALGQEPPATLERWLESIEAHEQEQVVP